MPGNDSIQNAPEWASFWRTVEIGYPVARGLLTDRKRAITRKARVCDQDRSYGRHKMV